MQPDPNSYGRACIALDLIGKLYRTERDIKDAPLTEKRRARQERSATVVTELKSWLDS